MNKSALQPAFLLTPMLHWSMYIEIHERFLLGRLLLSVIIRTSILFTQMHNCVPLLEHSNVCAGIPELPGTTRNYPELGGTGSSQGDQFIWVICQFKNKNNKQEPYIKIPMQKLGFLKAEPPTPRHDERRHSYQNSLLDSLNRF